MSGAGGGREEHVVLLVDDAVDNRVMYAEYLSFEGFRVIEADNGVQAIATARAQTPDAIVMDVGLPAIDGIEATKILRADPATKDIVVVALSGHGADVEERAAAAGVDRFVRKPCLPNELVDHLRLLLRERSAR